MTHISGLKSNFVLICQLCFSSVHHVLTLYIYVMSPINKHSSSTNLGFPHIQGEKCTRVRVRLIKHCPKFIKTALSRKSFDVWKCLQNARIFLTHILGECRPGTNTMKLTLMRSELGEGDGASQLSLTPFQDAAPVMCVCGLMKVNFEIMLLT